MQRRGFSEKEIFGVRLAVEEALVNAVKHGNRNDPAKCVWASWHVGPNRVLVEIEDEGEGFDPRAVPDPCAPENIERSCGRGLLLMRTYMTRVRHNRRGTALTMLGMAWGIATVVLLLAYGAGFGRAVHNIFSNFGMQVMGIFPGRTSMQAGGSKAPAFRHLHRNRPARRLALAGRRNMTPLTGARDRSWKGMEPSALAKHFCASS